MTLNRHAHRLYSFLRRYPKLERILRSAAPTPLKRHLRSELADSIRSTGRSRPVFRAGAYHPGALGKHLLPGCQLVGFAYGQSGLGEHLRYVAGALEAGGLPFSVFDYGHTLHPQTNRQLEGKVREDAPYRANLLCLNYNAILDLYQANPRLFLDRYNIGYGYWELSELPDAWLPVMNLLDEIWAPSQHIQRTVAAKASLPVVHMPIAVDFEPPEQADRSSFDLPEDRLLFVFFFDLSSTLPRKNPEGLIKAFRHAFPDSASDQSPLLVLKVKADTAQGDQKQGLDQLLASCAGDPRIRLIHETFPAGRMAELLACSDAFVSLHRAEGFGLGLAEAMRLGKPVIATGYSGNLDFTRPHNALLVDYRLVKVQPGEAFDLEGEAEWAEPDLDQAARHLQRLAREPELRERLGQRGKAFIEAHHSSAATAARYRQRLALLGLIPGEPA